MTVDKPLRRYLRVPTGERDAARALGARYDAGARRLYAPDHLDPAVFARWVPAPAVPPRPRADGTTSVAEAYLVIPKTLTYQPPVTGAWSRRDRVKRRHV